MATASATDSATDSQHCNIRMSTMTKNQAQQADWICKCWVHDSDIWCVTTGRISHYEYGGEVIEAAIVEFLNDDPEETSIPLEHLVPVAHAPGLRDEMVSGKMRAWESGRERSEDVFE